LQFDYVLLQAYNFVLQIEQFFQCSIVAAVGKALAALFDFLPPLLNFLPFSGPDIFLGRIPAKVLGSFFIAYLVNKSFLLFRARVQPVERFLIPNQLWRL